jgi:hypothetical protein
LEECLEQRPSLESMRHRRKKTAGKGKEGHMEVEEQGSGNLY